MTDPSAREWKLPAQLQVELYHCFFMSRRDHTAHDLASLRIDLFGETAKASSSQVFGRKARGTVDKRGNILATAPFKKRKRKAIEKDTITLESPGELTVVNVNDEALEGRPKTKRRTYYPSILPFLNVSKGTRSPTFRPENGHPTAVSIRSSLLGLLLH